ncbi:hypothetical protein C9426_27880 [Serratia sp. S1B]|nr:hypothetical protein C9426_27880 [Serratia sp. S1B]
MNVSSKIFIQHTCMYTRNGIKLLLDKLKDNGLDINISANVANFNATDLQAFDKNDEAIFILGLPTNNDDYTDFFYFIHEWLPMYSPCYKVVVIANDQSTVQLKEHLLSLHHVVAVLDQAMKLPELQLYLKNLIIGVEPLKYNSKASTPLSLQEIKVLDCL